LTRSHSTEDDAKIMCFTVDKTIVLNSLKHALSRVRKGNPIIDLFDR